LCFRDKGDTSVMWYVWNHALVLFSLVTELLLICQKSLVT
jgi:hypothetical protein